MKYLSAITLLLWSACGLAAGAGLASAGSGYVGARVCGGCHREQFQQWLGSDHDLAMQPATGKTVLGNFADTAFRYNGVTSTFYRKGGEFWVKTDGADGKLADFKIEYVFGVHPLQQYLVGFPDGRYQALNIAWDTRPKTQGGQRWFHLYPGQHVDHNDVLHWTRYAHNWNSRCADCHSTNLQKHYDPASDSYHTTWSEIDVACEACHGPGARHLQWARGDKSLPDEGLLRDLSSAGSWSRKPGQAIASLTPERSLDHRQVNTCAHCHSRRSVIADSDPVDSKDGRPSPELLNTDLVSLLEPGLYYPDGQIRDEDYVYGSFVQSKMYRHGVVCSNCHNPHTLKLREPGNKLCAQCHNPERYDVSSHHHHPEGSSGAQCVNCHMPETTYMVVDPRRDHSIRVPRPDLSKQLGVPNACNRCHRDKSVGWAVKAFRGWYPDRLGISHYGMVFHQAWQGKPQAVPGLAELANDQSKAIFVRASALNSLGGSGDPYALNTALTFLDSREPLLRVAALNALGGLDREQRTQYLWPLLDDPVKAVRLEATRLLAGVGLPEPGAMTLDDGKQKQWQRAVEDYVQSAQLNADAPAGQLQLGVFYLALGRNGEAIAAYRQALHLEPDYVPAMVNLADYYRAAGEDGQALPMLQRALKLVPEDGAINYAAGLLYIRQRRLDTALGYLHTAAAQSPDQAHYSYVYAVALYESGRAQKAVDILKQTLQRHPGDREVLSALVSYLTALGRGDEARPYAQQLRGY